MAQPTKATVCSGAARWNRSGPSVVEPEASTAFPYRDASHDLLIVASWLPDEAGDADRHIERVRGLFRMNANISP